MSGKVIMCVCQGQEGQSRPGPLHTRGSEGTGGRESTRDHQRAAVHHTELPVLTDLPPGPHQHHYY